MADKLILIDSMALVYRGHFALIRNPRIASTGLNTSAVFIFTQVLLQIIKEEAPTHIAVCCDTREPTFRHKQFPEYKAQREAMPEEIEAALPYVDRLIDAFNIPRLALPGWEADDIAGTIARMASERGLATALVTPDKDYAQLVDEHVSLYRPRRGGPGFDVYTPAEVATTWDVTGPAQVIDLLALMGDSSDNIPGVPGIGQKTAAKLLADYGSVEGLYEHVEEIKGKRKEKLIENKDMAFLSKELVTIDTAAPIDVSIDDLVKKEWDEPNLKKLFAELEFRTLGERLFGTDVMEEAKPEVVCGTLADVFHTYHVVDESNQASFFAALKQQESFCFDVETDGLESRHCSLLGISFCWQEHEAWFLPWPKGSQQADAVADLAAKLAPIFANTAVEKIGHNLKFDCSVLATQGMPVQAPCFDTMIAGIIALPESRHGMDALAKELLAYEPLSITTLIGEKGPDQLSMANVPLDKLAEYAAEDADVTWQLAIELRERIEELGQETVCNTVEGALVPVLAEIEAQGIRIDEAVLAKLGDELTNTIEQTKQRIETLAGEPVNINSPKQLGALLFDKLELDPKAKRTAKSKQYKTNEQVLQRLVGHHEIVQEILDYRAANKLKSVYVDQLPAAVDAGDGRIHTTYEQMVTSTGRLASHSPNLQNIPIRSEQGREIRRAFVPANEDYVLLAADYSQIELRIAAEMSGDEALFHAFTSGHDIHTATAMAVFDVPVDEVDHELRRRAKTVNFGILYGVSPFGLAERLQIPRWEAKDLIDGYFTRFHRLRDWLDEVVEQCRAKGYVETMLGRRRWLKDIDSRNGTVRKAAERNATNAPVQGTAADLIKLAMVNIAQLLREKDAKSKMLLQVHDELVFDLHKDERDWLPPLIAEAMSTAIAMKVPIEVEMGIADNWLEAH